MIGTSILRARTTVTVGTGVSRGAPLAVRPRSQPLELIATVAAQTAPSTHILLVRTPGRIMGSTAK
jgi:hypothetical protein